MALAAAALGAAILPATASAQEVQLGVTSTALAAPACPASLPANECNIVLPEMTAIATISDGVTYPTTVKQPGELVSFTLGVSELNTDATTRNSELSYLNKTYGGAPEAAVAVLRRSGTAASFRWRVAAESSAEPLQKYLGRVVEFPLAQSLPVVPGEVVALTVPTWAPSLAIDLSSTKFAYRQSRSASCTKVADFNPQLTIGQQARYSCDYPGNRVEYTATEVMTPAAAAAFRKANRHPVTIKR